MATPRKMNTPSPPAPIGGGDRRDADADHRRQADAGEDDAGGERQLDAPQKLAVGHAHAAPGLADARGRRRDADDGVPQDRQQRVERERHERRARADAPKKGIGISRPNSARLGIVWMAFGGAQDRALPRRPARERRCRAARRPRRECRPTPAPAAGARRVSKRISARHADNRRPASRNARTAGSARRRQRVGRAGIERGGRPCEQRQAIGDAQGLAQVVGDEDGRLARAARCSARNSVLQLAARDRVERAERLVQQDERRIGGERPRDADALALAAGELVRIPAAAVLGGRQTDQRRAAPRRAPRGARRPSRELRHDARRSRRPSDAERGRSPG